MTIIELNGSTILVRDYWSINLKKPVLDGHNDITVLGTASDGKTYVNVKYERLLNTGDSQDNALT
jgi:hypothetical protein